jgi:ribulose-5-phosphate 4-epimerase/fuculose-1-phosphate aldolase
MDGSSCAGLTASSELTAHREIIIGTGRRAVLHGHPRFAVIMSMDCDVADCPADGDCHRRCPRAREAAGVPVASGEVGTGRFGLCHTVPAALKTADGVIVYGHGVFATGRIDFTDAFETLQSIEHRCREAYFQRLSALSGGRF